MPSPSPNSRKTSSSVAARSLSGSTRGDLPGPTRGLLQGTGSSSSSASCSPCDRNDDHKENSTENGTGRGIQGRTNQNPRGSSKKPWVTHFSKPAGTLSPSNRILVDRNSSCSPLRSEGVVLQGFGEGRGNQKVRTPPPREREEAPVKGVAELSKRIQQFLEEQEVVLGIKTGSAQEVTSSSASVPPVELGQRSVSSPYNPYKSPFFERPKYLRLNGSSSSTMDEVDVVPSSTDVAEAAMEQTTEELPLFEGGQALATPLQQIRFSVDLSPLSTEDEDKAHAETTLEEVSLDALIAKVQPVSANEEDHSLELYEKSSQSLPFLAESLIKALGHAIGAECFENQSQVGEMEVETADGKEDAVGKSKVQFAPANQPEEKEDHAVGAECFDNQSQVGDMEVETTDRIKEDGVGKSKVQFAPANQPEEKEDHAVGAECFDNQSQVGDMEVETADRIKEDGVVKAKVQLAPASQPEAKENDHAVGAEQRKMTMQSPVGVMEVDGKEDGVVKAKDQFTPAVQPQGKEVGAGEAEYKSQPGGKASQSQAGEMKTPPQGKEVTAGLAYGDLEDLDEEVSWGERAGRVLFCGALLVALVSFVLLSSAGPGLLPSSLVNNPVHSSWHSSKYHENSMLFVRGMEGLWSTHNVYLPVDVRVAMERSAEKLHSIRKLYTQAHLELQIFAELTSSILDDWRKALLQHLSLRNNPNSDLEQEERGRQFEWLHDFEFEEEWLDEIPIVAYSDWELLHEYDLGAANQFILGSLPEVLKHGLWRNFSRLSDSPEVKGLLEDLMKLKGGNTEEDRLEVLQYFWEYTQFSASDRETLVQFQVGRTGVENGSPHQATSLDLPALDTPEEQNDSATDGPHSLILLSGDPLEEQSTDGQDSQTEHGKPSEQYLNEGAEADTYSTITGGPHSYIPLTDGPYFSKELQDYLAEDSQLNEQYLNKEAAEPSASLVARVGIEKKLSDVDLEMTCTSEQLQESHRNFPSNVAVNENAAELTEELKSESADMQIRPAFSAKLEIAHLATLAIFVVASMFLLARSRRSKTAPKLAPPVSTSVQFLRKTDQPQESLDDGNEIQSFTDAKQDKQQVTMIEELNDKFASVLQSPEPNLLPLQSLQTRRDEDLLRSPIPASTSSPYGSFTTYKLTSKKEGQAVETKLTPVRRSSRIRNHISMSPQTNAVKRIAISPP